MIGPFFLPARPAASRGSDASARGDRAAADLRARTSQHGQLPCAPARRICSRSSESAMIASAEISVAPPDSVVRSYFSQRHVASPGLPRLRRRASRRLMLFDRNITVSTAARSRRPRLTWRKKRTKTAGRRPRVAPDTTARRSTSTCPGAHPQRGTALRAVGPAATAPWFDVGYQFRGNGDVAAAQHRPLLRPPAAATARRAQMMPAWFMRVVLRDHRVCASQGQSARAPAANSAAPKAHPLASSAAGW